MKTITVEVVNDGRYSDCELLHLAIDELANKVVFVNIKSLLPQYSGSPYAPAEKITLVAELFTEGGH